MIRLGFFAALLAVACAAAQAETARDRAGREQFREASRICRYAPHAEQRACMARELCKNNRDPAGCEERYFVNAERRDLVLDACKGRQGTALRDCMREEYKKLDPVPGS
jgi:hypothetical protein